MNIIIPMAGRGSRLRPHTLTTPKPLLPVAGLPIVERLVEDIVRLLPEPVKKIAFVTGRFGEETENDLLDVAKRLGAVGSICYRMNRWERHMLFFVLKNPLTDLS